MLPLTASNSARSPRPEALLRAAVLGLFALSTAAFIYFAFVSPSFYLFPDALYYDAVADALARTGRLFDPSLQPPQAIYTPQNGIVFLNAAIRLGTPQARQIVIGLLGLAAFGASTIFIFKIIRALVAWHDTALLAAAAFASSPLVLRVAAAPLNDIFFIAMFLGGLVALATLRLRPRLIVMTALAPMLSFFRLQGIVLFCAAALGTWHGRRREALLYGVLACLDAAMPFAVEALLSDNSAHVRSIMGDILSFHLLLDNVLYMLGMALPKLLTAAGPGLESFMYVLFPLGAAIYLTVARRTFRFVIDDRRFHAIAAAATLGTMLFVVITPYYDPRYYLCIYPFIIIVPLLGWASRTLVNAALIVACLANLLGLGSRLLFADVDFSNNSVAARSLQQSAPTDAQLLSEDHELAYFVFRRPSLAQPTTDHARTIVLFGSAAWRNATMLRLGARYEATPLAGGTAVTVRFTPNPVRHAGLLLRIRR